MSKMTISRLAAAVSGLVLLAGAAQAQDVTLRVHHFQPVGSPTQVNVLEPWAERIEKASNGRIKVQIFPSMQLGGKPPQLFDQVRDGVVDVAWTLLGYTPGRFPIAEVFELPFMPTTAEATSQAVQAFADKHLKDELRQVHPLLLHVPAPGKFHMVNTPIKGMDDLKGKKIRAPSRTVTEALSALGATPVGMPAPELAQSLSTGVLDGAVIPWEAARALRIPDVTKYHTSFGGEHGFYTSVFLLSMNRSKYNDLPDDLKKVIDDNSGMNIVQEIGQALDKVEAEAQAAAAERGNEMIVIPAEDEARWKEATQPVIDAWVAEMDKRGLDGKALLEEARGLIDQYTKK